MASKSMSAVKHLWETWDIRILVLVSLAIQVLLTFLAPQRKRWARGIFKFGIWLLYLVADAVALYTIRLISSSKADTTQGTDQKADLLAFWAPFLLLHLGGPDTITALALEDNELWHRHALQLVIQVVTTIYVFIRSFHRNSLWLPTILMFVDGFIKYTERTCALYFASMENFVESQQGKPEAGPNYARLMEEYSSAIAANIPTEIKSNVNKFSSAHPSDDIGEMQQLTDEEAVQEAYKYYEKFKDLLADSFVSLKDRDESQAFFLRRPPGEAFRIIEIELNFIYDVFYTKVFLLHRRRSYARLICYALIVASLFFFFMKDKSDYHSIDIGITFTLLWGAISLDISGPLMLLFSDWWIIVVTTWVSSNPKPLTYCFMWLRHWLRYLRGWRCRRWSRSISQYNLLNRCFDSTRWFEYICVKKIRDILIGCSFVDSYDIDEEMVNFIVQELQKKARPAMNTEATKDVCSARGTLIFEDDYFLISECLRPWTVEVDYDESLLTWHLATDLCYQTCTEPDKDNKYCKFSKVLSDYMSYLVLTQQALVSPVVGASNIRFGDTREDAKKFIQNSWVLRTFPHDKQKFCEKVLEVKAEVQPVEAKGDKSKSVLFDACRLAKQLKMFKEEQWVIMSKVWVELLSYAAILCSPRSHVARLSKGGEVITIVWLLMAHLGLGERFRQNQGFGLTKLVIHK